MEKVNVNVSKEQINNQNQRKKNEQKKISFIKLRTKFAFFRKLRWTWFTLGKVHENTKTKLFIYSTECPTKFVYVDVIFSMFLISLSKRHID